MASTLPGGEMGPGASCKGNACGDWVALVAGTRGSFPEVTNGQGWLVGMSKMSYSKMTGTGQKYEGK